MSEIPEDEIAALFSGNFVLLNEDGTRETIPIDKMMKPLIPEDIRSAAARAVGPTIDPRGELATRVAEAILAERERCAEVFRWFRKEAVLMVLDSHTNDVANAALHKIESGEA